MSSWSDQDDVRPPPCPGCGLATPIFKVVVESGRRHYQWLTVVLTACLLTGCSPFPHLNTFSPSEQAQEPLDIAYSKIARQRLDVFEQVSAHTQAAPVAIFYYGGAWDRGSRADYRFVGRTLPHADLSQSFPIAGFTPRSCFGAVSMTQRPQQHGFSKTRRGSSATRHRCF